MIKVPVKKLPLICVWLALNFLASETLIIWFCMNLKARRLIKFSNQPELTVVVDLRKSKICYTAKAMFIFINKLSFHTANIVKLQEAASIKMFYIKKTR